MSSKWAQPPLPPVLQLSVKRCASTPLSLISYTSSSWHSSPMEEDVSFPLSASIGEPVLSDYSVHKLSGHKESSGDDLVVNTAIMATPWKLRTGG